MVCWVLKQLEIQYQTSTHIYIASTDVIYIIATGSIWEMWLFISWLLLEVHGRNQVLKNPIVRKVVLILLLLRRCYGLRIARADTTTRTSTSTSAVAKGMHLKEKLVREARPRSCICWIRVQHGGCEHSCSRVAPEGWGNRVVVLALISGDHNRRVLIWSFDPFLHCALLCGAPVVAPFK